MCNNMCGRSRKESACPFAFSDVSEMVQNYGCLPTPYEIIQMRIKHGKTWACHTDYDKPCVGAIEYLKENGMPYTVIDPILINETSRWDLYIK